MFYCFCFRIVDINGISSIDNLLNSEMDNLSSYDTSGLALNTSRMGTVCQSINSEFGMYDGSLSSTSESDLESENSDKSSEMSDAESTR